MSEPLRGEVETEMSAPTQESPPDVLPSEGERPSFYLANYCSVFMSRKTLCSHFILRMSCRYQAEPDFPSPVIFSLNSFAPSRAVGFPVSVCQVLNLLSLRNRYLR